MIKFFIFGQSGTIITNNFLFQAKAIISRIQEYFYRHPEIIVIDPLDNIKILINRYKSYEIMKEHVQSNGKYKILIFHAI